MSRLASIFVLVAMLAAPAGAQITFGTSGDYIQVSTNRLGYGTNYTVTAWVKPNKTLMNANTYGGVIIGDRSGYTSTGDRNCTMFYGKTAGLGFQVICGPEVQLVAIGTNAVVDGKWVHLVGVCDGNAVQARLYADGAFIGSKNLPGAPDTNSVGTRIGNWAWAKPSDGYQWEGSLQDIRIYSRVLSASEIATMALYPWALADDPALILRTCIDQKQTGTDLDPFNAENHGTQLITPMNYVSGVTSAVTRVQIAKPLQMELP